MKKIAMKLSIILLITIIIVLCVINISTTKATTTTLADTVISLSQGDTYTAGNGNGVYQTNNHEYRYVGGEVNNYVSFNNDLYRIIGVFDDNSHGVTGQNLVKLISAKKLISVAWGAYNSSSAYTTYSNYNNDWTGSTTGVPASANLILNEYFYNATDTSTTYGECINWTYGYNNDTYKSKNCSNIKGYGIQSQELRNYIQPVTWYLYGWSSNDLTKQNWYQCERNNYNSWCNRYPGTATANIGLMYVSDYMYASGYIASNDTNTVGGGYTWINSNWLYNGNEWTITTKSNFTDVFIVDDRGYVSNNASYYGLGLRPTFYLKSNIYVTGGNGSFSNPYTIACDDCNS